ncbi:MAG: helix-turn-helix transcriptional regulator [Caulobacteraceae bacterium]
MLGMAAVQTVRMMPRVAPRTREHLSEQQALGRALAVIRKRADLTQTAAAERIGLRPQTWSRYEAGERDNILRTDLQERLARAVDADRETLLLEKARILGEPPPPRSPVTPGIREPAWGAPTQVESAFLPIRDRIQAGAWLMADDTGQTPPRVYPAVRDPRFAKADQWLSEVVGDSVDLLNIFEGDLVHCIDAVAMGYYPKTGDIVEVERIRFGGQERELTIKQVEVLAQGCRLWPRSSNPRWREPLELRQGLAEGEEVEVRIRALVTTVIRRLAI